jgi:hypothetical protein
MALWRAKLTGALFTQIDEFIFKINPVLIGVGIPLFHGVTGTIPAKLIRHKAYPNGFVLAHYVQNYFPSTEKASSTLPGMPPH